MGAAATSSAVEVLEFELPPMPKTLSEILQLRSQETPDLDRLIQVTGSDPAIAAGVLRRVNAAYYGLRREVYQVDRAVKLLGFNEVCRLAFTASVRKAFTFKDAPDATEVYDHLMRTSIATAAFARHLSSAVKMRLQEAAFTAGLLHQLGRMALLYRSPSGYARLWRSQEAEGAAEPAPLAPPSLPAEYFVFNTTSVRLGGILAQHWGLPDNLATVIAHFSDPSQVASPVLRVLTLVVAAARAAAEQMHPDPSVVAPNDLVSDALVDLAARRHVEVQELALVLFEQRETVLQFAETMAHE